MLKTGATQGCKPKDQLEGSKRAGCTAKKSLHASSKEKQPSGRTTHVHKTHEPPKAMQAIKRENLLRKLTLSSLLFCTICLARTAICSRCQQTPPFTSRHCSAVARCPGLSGKSPNCPAGCPAAPAGSLAASGARPVTTSGVPPEGTPG